MREDARGDCDKIIEDKMIKPNTGSEIRDTGYGIREISHEKHEKAQKESDGWQVASGECSSFAKASKD